MASKMRDVPITWVQVEKSALEDLSKLIRRAPVAARLATLFVSQLTGGRGVIVMSRTAMKEALGVSMPTVERALSTLIREGWVQRMRIGSAHALAINCRIAWAGPRGDMPRAAFGALVVASRSEQDAIALNPPPIRALPAFGTGEFPVQVGPGLDPPSQPGLDGVPPPAIELRENEELDPITGEIQTILPGLPKRATTQKQSPKTSRSKP